MRYGYFDEQAREYVITRPDTPAPWANYLGSPEYGALISNNAGGYSFVRSGANGRLLRYVFNQFDQPGRYLYLRDNEDGDFWSASWQPVGKDLETYRSECRHGTGYTKMLADYSGIHSEAVYYVPLDASHEVWLLSVTNQSEKRRELTLTGYAEFTSNGNYEQDQVNLQYSQFITRTLFDRNRVRQQIHGNLDAQSSEVDAKIVIERFFGLAGAAVGGGVGYYLDVQEAELRAELASTGVSVERTDDSIRLIMPGNITFKTDSADINAGFYATLNSVAKVLNKYSNSTVMVMGFTDNTGADAYNMTLSKQRATAVAAYLQGQGVKSTRFEIMGMGPSNPIASNATAAGRQQNRRVEIKIIPNK